MNDVGARYGLFLGGIFGLLIMAIPRPWGHIVMFSLVTVHGLYGSWIVWSRAGLRFVSLAGLAGAAGLACWAVLMFQRGDFVTGFSSPLLWIGTAGFALSVLFFALEPRRNPEGWKRWGEAMEQSTVLDILLMRHVPRLR